jgi:hypothetical protein
LIFTFVAFPHCAHALESVGASLPIGEELLLLLLQALINIQQQEKTRRRTVFSAKTHFRIVYATLGENRGERKRHRGTGNRQSGASFDSPIAGENE